MTTTTRTKTYEQFEQALGGYDWEIGLRLPLPVKAEKLEARVFGGYYDFDNDLGAEVDGWKARAELRLASSLFLDAGVYEDDQLTGSDWFAGARLSVPLDLSAIAKGRNPFATAKSRLEGAPRDLAARLTEMVMRDPQVRLDVSKFNENPDLATEQIARSRDKDSTAYVLLPDVQFVDGGAGAPGDGTAENPFPTIQQGANAVYGSRNVYVNAFPGIYPENVVLLPGTTLWGSGVLVPGFDNQFFGSGIQPVVDGRSLGPSITVADNTTVKGFYVQNTDLGGPDQFVIIPGMPTYNTRRIGIYGYNATDFTIDRNTLSGNDVGALFSAEENSLNFLFTDSLATGNDIGAEVLASGGGGGTFFADFQNSSFYHNTGSGLLLLSLDYIESIARFANGNVSDNAVGLEFIQNGNILAMSLISGAQANNNAIGLQTVQTGNLFGLVNISDSEANANTAFGIQNVQYSQMASVGIIGMPEGLADSANALASLFGLTLPEEVGMFLSPAGPITANGNGAFGVQSVVQTDSGLALGGLFSIAANGNGADGVQSVVTVESGLALGALFDITANGNGADGINAVNNANHGIAIGVAGSTEVLADLVDLGTEVASLFGLDLPLAITSDGHLEANGNSGVGFRMTTTGSNTAVNAVVGLDTLGNGDAGTFLGTYSDNLSIAALARLYTAENVGAGLLFDMVGRQTGAVGVLADVFADVNGDSGITASVDSPNGFAALLALSTDVLRPLAADLGADFLGGAIHIPGAPFGPLVASGNTGDGFNAHVTGADFAAALFVDTVADGNSGNGFNLNVASSNGLAILAMVSSDVALEVVNALDLLPDPIYFNPVGLNSASDNGANGVLANVNGGDGAYAALIGLTADNNTGGDGIHATLTSTNGPAFAALIETDAAGNSDEGIELTMNSLGSAFSALAFVDVTGNANQGVLVNQTSTGDDALALLGGVDAISNGTVGIHYNLTAADLAAACITESESMYNGGAGANLALTAGGDAALLMGTNALANLLSSGYVGGFGGFLLGAAEDLIPVDEPEFNNNGAAGLRAEMTSTGGDVLFNLDGVIARANTNNGLNLVLNAPAGDILGYLGHAAASDNGGNGINLDLTGAGGTLDIWLDRLTTARNDVNGLNVVENYNGTVLLGGERIVSVNNVGNGVRLVMSGLTVPTLDFGGGLLGSTGNSSIYGNGNRDFRYNNGGGATVMAENNWWGTATPVAGQFAGSIDYTPVHPGPDPNAP